MDKLEKERFNKMYDVVMDIGKDVAVSKEQNKNIVQKIESLTLRQSEHEILNQKRHEQNAELLDTLGQNQLRQTWTKQLWDKFFTGLIAAATAGITWYISIHYR